MSRLADRLRRLPMRVRLAVAGTLILPPALAVVFGLVFLRFEAELNSAIDVDLRARFPTLKTVVDRDGRPALKTDQARQLLRPLGAYAQIVDSTGRVLGSSEAVRHVRLLTPGQAASATRHRIQTDRDRIEGVAKRSRLVASPLRRGTSALVVGRSLKDREGANESFGRALLIGGPLALLLSAAACYLAAAAALRPVETMRRRASEITGPDVSGRLPVPVTDDEISRLGHTLNDMLGRLERSSNRQRELAQNASHELRTPLAVLTGEIELALQHDLDADSREAMAIALQEARRVGRLADDLLTLAQLEEDKLPLALETVDLDEILRLTAARAARQSVADGRRVLVDSETAFVQADAVRMEQAVGNLVDNALQHGRGPVEVTLRTRSNAAEITVRDDGPGIAPQFRDRAFERFTQSANGQRHGAGLGLAIVKAIAEAHGGSASISDEAGRSVTISIPRAPVEMRTPT